MDARWLCFFVPGLPAPGGSKKAFVPKGWTRVVVTEAGGKKNKEWRAVVALAAMEAMQQQSKYFGDKLFDGPLSLTITFVMPRLKGHFNSRGELKTNAPHFVTTRPDLLKLARSTEDAMTGVVYRDDSQIAVESLDRVYGEQTGAHIKITEAGRPRNAT